MADRLMKDEMDADVVEGACVIMHAHAGLLADGDTKCTMLCNNQNHTLEQTK